MKTARETPVNRIDRHFTEVAEEILEALYLRTIERDEPVVAASDFDASSLEELLQYGAIEVDEERIALSEAGIEAGRSVVRRHRLAERLLADVLGSGEPQMHEQACRFEHVIGDGLEEQICTLLGHPKICPHGKPIPEGECCRRREEAARPIIGPLSMMRKAQKATVAYINATEPEILNKLMAMGILPGVTVALIQSFPSFVFQSGQSQFAVDRDIAETIFVRTG